MSPMGADGDRIFRFERFEVDLTRNELRRDGTPISVEPQVFDVLSVFVRNNGQILTRDDLIEEVWGGRIVSDSAISTRIKDARAVLGDDGTTQRFIRTLPKRGFIFEAEVTAGSPVNLAPSTKPSIAILPFRNLSGDPEQAYFSDGITDDIITDLSRFRELFVSARYSSFAYRDSAAPLTEIAETLGVQYIVNGSVRRAGSRIRINVELIEPEAGHQIWAERYDREVSDIFDLQDEIAALVVNTLAGEISYHRHRRSMGKGAQNITAYDHYLRASELNHRMVPSATSAARDEAKRAIRLDPDNARAHALIGWTYVSEGSNAWTDPETAFENAAAAADAAIEADDRDPFGYAVTAWVQMWRDQDYRQATANLKTALGMVPSSGHYRSYYAYALSYCGQSEDAIAELNEIMSLYPHYPEIYRLFLGRAMFNLKRYDDASQVLDRASRSMPEHTIAVAYAAACSAAKGEDEAARFRVEQVRRSSPGYTLAHARNYSPYSDPSEKAHFIEMLERAGLPES